MAVSLESRVPLLDYRIVEFAVQLPYILKFRGKETKSVVRWYARTLLPPEILERTDKVGFSPPSQFWYGDSMRELVCQALDPNSVCAQSIIEPKALAAVRHAYAIRDNSYLLYLWRIVNLDLWFRIF